MPPKKMPQPPAHVLPTPAKNKEVAPLVPVTSVDQPKRGRGRPRKNPSATCACAICLDAIVEATETSVGEEALFCEGHCQAWLHRRCAFITKARFVRISSSEVPFLCCYCQADTQHLATKLLQDEVAALRIEVAELRAALEAVRAVDNSSSIASLREEIEQWKLKAQPPCDNGPAELWSQMVRKGRGKGPGKGKGKGMDKEPKSTSHAQPAQPSLSSQPSKRPSRPSKPVPNKRKIWGTPRVCTASSVKKAITQLAGVEGSKVEVKRKYKKDGEKLVKWWHVVRADEGILDKLEQEWSKVNVQTSWQLVPCLIFYDNAQASNPSNQDTQAFVENKAHNTGGSNAVDNDVVENNTAAASSNNGVQSTVNQSHASPEAHHPPLHPEQISFSSSFLGQ